MIGPGKYDRLCTKLRKQTQADAAVAIILNGKRGSGFSVQAPLDVTMRLPELLRELADQIERDHKQGQL